METGTFYEEPPTECKKKLRRQDDFRRRKTHSASLRATLRSRLRLGSFNRQVCGSGLGSPSAQIVR